MRALAALVFALAAPAAALAQDLSTLIGRVAPSVVVLSDEQAGAGSGFVASADGVIVTSLHVVARMRAPRVTVATGEVYDAVTVQAYDRDRDLALLKVAATGLRPLKLADSGKVSVGQRVVAFGTPLGLSGTVTAGIVSAVRAHPRIPGARLLQTDAASNPGNSGGPLVDGRGRVVGIVTSLIRAAQNLGFAVPSNDLKELLLRRETGFSLEELRKYLLASDWAGQVLARRWRAEGDFYLGRPGSTLYELESSGESLRLTFLRPQEETRLGQRLTLSLLRKGAGYEGLAAGDVNCETLRESRRVPWLQESAVVKRLALERIEVSFRAPAPPDPEGDCKLAYREHTLTLVPAAELEAAPATGEPEYLESVRQRRADFGRRRALLRENCREVRAKLARDCVQVNEWSAASCRTFSDLAAVCEREGL